MSGPLITELPLWERHEQRVRAVLRSALHRLRTQGPTGDEPKLNRALYFCMLEVNKEHSKSGGLWVNSPLILNGQNPPTPDTEDSASERKIPDLQWGFVDHNEPDPHRYMRTFTIECKRLGAPSTSGWKFNVHYVCNGVRRFIDPEWRYGNDVATGAMVGYVESLTPEQVVSEVNKVLNQLGVSALTLPPGADGSLTEMEHSLWRPFAISPFKMVHLWIDIRPSV